MSELTSIEISQDILNDLCSRFILNVPKQDRYDLVRICFQIELAHWFYVDNYSENNYVIPFIDFASQIYKNVPLLYRSGLSIQEILNNWNEYKKTIPTFGAIILSEGDEYVLFVKSFLKRAPWSFPKGKINEDESPVACAIREVREEIGFDISDSIDENLFVELAKDMRSTRLYIIRNVSLKTRFMPKTRYEIQSIRWFLLENLPSNVNGCQYGDHAYQFAHAMPFLRQLRKTLRELELAQKFKEMKEKVNEYFNNYEKP